MAKIKESLIVLVAASLGLASCAKSNQEYVACRESGKTREQCRIQDKPGALPQQSNSPLESTADSGDTVHVTEAVEYVKGLDASVMTNEFVSSVEEFEVKRLKQGLAVGAKEAGEDLSDVRVWATSIRFTDNDQFVIITELHTATSPPRPTASIKIIWWVQDSSIKRVICTDISGSDINIRHGACGRQVAKTFGYTSWYID